MEHWKLGPALSPSHEDWREALAKGLGRAQLWGRSGKRPDRALLEEACLRELRYDRQCEPERSAWLWEILLAADAIEWVEAPILAALSTLDDDAPAEQLCSFAVHYARRGDDRFRQALRKVVAQKPISIWPSLGEEQLMELDGLAGFMLAAHSRGSSPHCQDDPWDDYFFVGRAIRQFGIDATLAELERDSPDSPGIHRIYDHWRAKTETESSRNNTPAKQEPVLTVEEVLQKAETPNRFGGFFRCWGKKASEAELRIVRERIGQTANPDTLKNLLAVFANREMPDFRCQLLSFCDHADESLRARAYDVFGKLPHPAIRAFALQHLRERFGEWQFLHLFQGNFEPGDESLLLAELRPLANPVAFHSVLMDLHSILEANPAADCQSLGTIVYAQTPCAVCRRDALALLLERGAAPSWMVEEARLDCDEETRRIALAASASKSSQEELSTEGGT